MKSEALDYILQKAHNAMLDEIIDANLKILTQQPFKSSVEYFCESGKCSGSFRIALREMLDYYGKICEQ
jgi:hypothetical protein